MRLLLEVPADDQIPFGMRGEPALATPHELVDLGLVDPVVLVVIEDRQEHVQVGEQLREPPFRDETQAHMATVSPIGVRRIERDRRHLDLVAQGLEQPPHERFPTARRHDGQPGLERNRGRCQLLVPLARARHRALEDVDQRDRQERRRDVRPIVHVLGEREAAHAAAAPNEADRIDVEQHCRRAARLGRLRVEDARLAERQPNDCTRSGCLCSR